MPVPQRLIARLRQSAGLAVARAAGLVAGRRARRGRIVARRKGEGDFVTAVDVAAERLLRDMLLDAWPTHGFLGEESGGIDLDAELVWVVDPIDGTSNFARGLAHFGVAVACLHRGTPIAAAVHCEPESATYTAALGEGARRARTRLRVADRALSDASIVGTQWHRGPRDLRFAAALTTLGARLRVLGSTVTQLCDVAAGRLDANVQEQGRVWDFAAAALIATEAGARFTGWDGRPLFPLDLSDPAVVAAHFPSIAAPPRAHRRLVELLRG